MKKTPEKPDLTKVNPMLAAKILNQVNWIRPVAPVAKALAAPTKYDLVGQKLQKYKDAVNSKLKDIFNKAVVSLLFITVTFIFLILALVYSNLASLVGSAGLGTTSVIAQATTWKDTLIAYINDSGKLRRRVDYLEAEYKSCDPNNVDEVKRIDDMIKQDFLDLDKAQGS